MGAKSSMLNAFLIVAFEVVIGVPMDITPVKFPLPKIAISMNERSRDGIEQTTSQILIITASIFPP